MSGGPHEAVDAGEAGTAAAGMTAASTAEALVGTIASPCNNICTMDREAGWCIGCRRTRDEIAAWRRLDDAPVPAGGA